MANLSANRCITNGDRQRFSAVSVEIVAFWDSYAGAEFFLFLTFLILKNLASTVIFFFLKFIPIKIKVTLLFKKSSEE